MDAGLAADHPVTVAAKQVPLELLKVKADLERELGTWVLGCTVCGMEVRVQGHQHGGPKALRTPIPGAPRRAEHLSLWSLPE